MRDVLEEAVTAAGGTLTLDILAKLIDAEPQKYRERVFKTLQPVTSINPSNAIRALHKREEQAQTGQRKAHLAVFPMHYWGPKTYSIGTKTTVSIDVVEDDED